MEGNVETAAPEVVGSNIIGFKSLTDAYKVVFCLVYSNAVRTVSASILTIFFKWKFTK